MVVIIGVSYLCGGNLSSRGFSSRGFSSRGFSSSGLNNSNLLDTCGEGMSESMREGTCVYTTETTNSTLSIVSGCGKNGLLLYNGLGNNLGRGLVSGNSSLGNKMAHIVSAGIDDGGSLVVGDTNRHSPLAEYGGLHSIGVSLIGPVGKVATQTMALDDGRVMGWGANSYGCRYSNEANWASRGYSSQAQDNSNRVHDGGPGCVQSS